MSQADFHTHSTVSDGRLAPAELVRLAASKGVKLMALTDHDNTAGLEEARASGEACGVKVVAGVEISADYEPGTMHILGLGIRPEVPGLQQKLAWLQEARRTRNPRVAARLKELGVEVSLEQVERLAGGGQVGRPHFAQAIIDLGKARDFEEAFSKFLAKGAPAYIPKARLSPQDSIAAIHLAGGVAVLAHPVQLKLGREELDALLGRLKAAGLDALEAWHSDHAPADTDFYVRMAHKHGLGLSGGSDYHGIPGRKVELGEPGLDLEAARKLLGGRV